MEMRGDPVTQLFIAFVDISLLEIVIVGFLDAVVDQQRYEGQSCHDGHDYAEQKDTVVPYSVFVELDWCVLLNLVPSNQTEHTDQQLAIEHDINEGDFGRWRQGVVDDRHQAHIDDHQGGNISNFIVEVRPLDEGKQG
jgi:hypothetical protein